MLIPKHFCFWSFGGIDFTWVMSSYNFLCSLFLDLEKESIKERNSSWFEGSTGLCFRRFCV